MGVAGDPGADQTVRWGSLPAATRVATEGVPMAPMSRRALLRYGAGMAAGLPLALGVGDATWAAGRGTALTVPRQLRELPQPLVLRSSKGQLSVNLTPRQAVVDMNAPGPVTTYAYDGVVPGHTWELEPGDLLKVHLDNQLPMLPSNRDPVKDIDRPHHFTFTNLHTHGLHVSPSDNADNIFVVIEPDQQFDFEFPIPTDHTGGIFWYHPHHHGSVTQQVPRGWPA